MSPADVTVSQEGTTIAGYDIRGAAIGYRDEYDTAWVTWTRGKCRARSTRWIIAREMGIKSKLVESVCGDEAVSDDGIALR